MKHDSKFKDWFTADQAALWLAKKTDNPMDSNDVHRLAEAGRLRVCFRHRGNVGVFSYPAKTLPPTSSRKFYFDGYLASITPPNLCRLSEHIVTHKRPDGKTVIKESTTRADTLNPRKVEIVEAIHLHGDPSELAANEFLGLEYGRNIAAEDWLFHVDDLAALIADQDASTDTLPAKDGQAAQEPDSDKKDWRRRWWAKGPYDPLELCQHYAERLWGDGTYEKKKGQIGNSLADLISQDITRRAGRLKVPGQTGISPSAIKRGPLKEFTFEPPKK